MLRCVQISDNGGSEFGRPMAPPSRSRLERLASGAARFRRGGFSLWVRTAPAGIGRATVCDEQDGRRCAAEGAVRRINHFSQGKAEPVTLDEAREDPNVFLIPVRANELNTRRAVAATDLVESCLRMLEDWYVDESLWPRSRTRKMIQEWCELRTHSVVLDCLNEPLEHRDV
jgi:hypothetical protein